MKLATTLATLCCGLLIYSACKKDDDNSNGNNNNSNKTQAEQALETGKWQLTSSVLTTTYMGKDTTINYLEDCEKDNLIQFMGNGSGTVDEGANVCSGQAQTGTFTWTLLNSDTKLAIIDNNPDTPDVLQLTATEMKLSLTKPNSSGTPVTNIRVYKNVQ